MITGERLRDDRKRLIRTDCLITAVHLHNRLPWRHRGNELIWDDRHRSAEPGIMRLRTAPVDLQVIMPMRVERAAVPLSLPYRLDLPKVVGITLQVQCLCNFDLLRRRILVDVAAHADREESTFAHRRH